MKKTVIICEYNPFTNGHAHHIALAKQETGADAIVCIMSGSFTQRGEAAVLDRYKRAELAVENGADLVIELPLVYAISPADNFAYGAMKTVAAIGEVSCVSFGSECGDIEKILKAASFTQNEPEAFKNNLQRRRAEGYSYPKAYAMSLHDLSETDESYQEISDIFDQPNNCLGICYVKAAKRLGLNVGFHTIKRESNDNSEELVGAYPSASSIRKALRMKAFDSIADLVPEKCLSYLREIDSDEHALHSLCLFKIRSVNGYDLMKYYDMDVAGGLHNRLKLAADEAATFEDFLLKVKSKRYTMARIKRICLYVLFDITQETYDEAIKLTTYLNVLAVRKSKKEILAELRNGCDNILLRFSDISKVDKSLRHLIKLDFQAHGTLSLINRTQITKNTALFIE